MATTTLATSSTSTGIPLAESANPNKPVGKKELDKSDFMKLFVTQLQYQDPMKPMESNEMASQLAQFSNMEATMKMADNMQKMLDYQTSQNNLQLLTLIGRDVRAEGDNIGVDSGTPGKAFFDLKEIADSCTVNIYDAGGRQVKSIEMGYTESGLHDVKWDGKDFSGKTVPDGAYSFSVVAMTPLGQRAEVQTQSVGKVTGVSFNAGTAKLTLDNHASIGVGDVMEVLQKTSGTESTGSTTGTSDTDTTDDSAESDTTTSNTTANSTGSNTTTGKDTTATNTTANSAGADTTTGKDTEAASTTGTETPTSTEASTGTDTSNTAPVTETATTSTGTTETATDTGTVAETGESDATPVETDPAI